MAFPLLSPGLLGISESLERDLLVQSVGKSSSPRSRTTADASPSYRRTLPPHPSLVPVYILCGHKRILTPPSSDVDSAWIADVARSVGNFNPITCYRRAVLEVGPSFRLASHPHRRTTGGTLHLFSGHNSERQRQCVLAGCASHSRYEAV